MQSGTLDSTDMGKICKAFGHSHGVKENPSPFKTNCGLKSKSFEPRVKPSSNEDAVRSIDANSARVVLLWEKQPYSTIRIIN